MPTKREDPLGKYRKQDYDEKRELPPHGEIVAAFTKASPSAARFLALLANAAYKEKLREVYAFMFYICISQKGQTCRGCGQPKSNQLIGRKLQFRSGNRG